jgi:hypothetical protein
MSAESIGVAPVNKDESKYSPVAAVKARVIIYLQRHDSKGVRINSTIAGRENREYYN